MGLLRALGLAERAEAGAGVRAKNKYTSSLSTAAACRLRQPASVDDTIASPGVARKSVAVSQEVPDGSPGSSDYTVLQRHVEFFDRDNDGVITPVDTFAGFRRIGFGRAISFGAVLVIHGTFSMPTWPNALPRLNFPIFIGRMHRTVHGSDSRVLDSEGRFVPQRFEDMFAKYDTGGKGGLNWDDIQDMVYANMDVNDFVGWIAGRLEWWVLWLAAADDKGFLSKEKIRAMYDGTLWDVLAKEQTAKRGYEVWPLPRPSPRRSAPDSRKAAAPMTPAKPPREPTSMGAPLVGQKIHAT